MKWSDIQAFLNELASIPVVHTDTVHIMLHDLLVVGFGLVFLWFARNWIHRLAAGFVARQIPDPKQAYAVTRLLDIGAGFVLLLLALGMLGIELQSLMTVFAALGIGIGFGIQNLVNNAVSGIILLVERPVRSGDIIEVDSNFGLVQDIGWRATRIINWDNVEILVPNSRLLEANVINWTLSDSVARVGIPLGVAYGTDRKLLRQTALEVARSNPRAEKVPEPILVFKEYGDSSLNYMLSIWTREPWMKNMIISEIREALLDAFEAQGIQIPFPQRDIHLKTP